MQVEHVERPIDNFVQLFISPHRNSQQLLASSLSVYLRMYIYMLSKSQVSEALHEVSRAITSEPWKSKKQTLVPNSTALICLTSCEA